MHHPAHHTADSPETPNDEGRAGVLASMCLALVLVVASVSSVNLALTEISLDLDTSSEQLTWIADAYTVALAALVLPFGALGDKLGRRTLLLIGTVVFGIAALLASMAGNAENLIACRAAMGVGAAMIMPGTLSTITAVFSADRRPKAVSVWAGFASSGAILGLLTCGLVLEWFTWRASFVATAVLAVVSFIGSWLMAPNTSDPDEVTIDLPGSALSAIGVGALVFGIIDGAEVGWGTSTTVTALSIAVAAMAGFVWWELRTPAPMLDVRLFGLRGFATGALALTVQFFCLFGFFLVGLQFLQLLLDLSPLVSAVSLLPLGMIVMPLSRRAPHVVDRLGARRVMTAGLTFLGAGLLIMSTLDAGSSYWPFLAGLIVFGLGMAFTSTPSTTAIVTSLPRAKQGVASAMNDVSREVGSAIGIAVLGSLFSAGYRDAVTPATTSLPEDAAHAAGESAGAGLAIAERLGSPGAALDAAVRDAFAAGLTDAMRAGALIAIIAALFVAWRGPVRGARPEPAGTRDHTMTREFRTIDPSSARVVLVEGGGRVLPTYPDTLSEAAHRHLLRLGVEVRTECRVVGVDETGVDTSSGAIASRTVLWAAGVAASPLGRHLGVPLDRAGRVVVQPDLSVADHPEILVIGDLAAATQADGTPVPGVAPAAAQAGRHAAAVVRADLHGCARPVFRYRDKGSMATIGRSRAVADLGRFGRASGFNAWILWWLVHLAYLRGVRSRVAVWLGLVYQFATLRREARLITVSAPPRAPLTVGDDRPSDGLRKGSSRQRRRTSPSGSNRTDATPRCPRCECNERARQG